MQTNHLHINGIVQGVGFRPLVYQLATARGLKGYVRNGNDGLHIYVNATAAEAAHFLEQLIRSAPNQARIISATHQPVSFCAFDGFDIRVQDDDSARQVWVAPDVATCATCKAELHDPLNRRYRYPFITCTQCGPRYSIMESLPYERHATAMQPFAPCARCTQEYNDLTDRRFFSQTNSCRDCGVSLLAWEDEKPVGGLSEDILQRVQAWLKQGKIVAVKGIGGFLLLCDAANGAAIELLRKRKQRPAKPFALLYPHIEAVVSDFNPTALERRLLESAASPIVLMCPEKNTHQLATDIIAPGLKRMGVMLPGNPLLDLIARDFNAPLVATSANFAGSPIIFKEAEALALLSGIADCIAGNTRAIVVPQDDSVVQVARLSQQPIVIRRSRGYAPCWLRHSGTDQHEVLAMGAFLKSSFTIAMHGHVFISQYLGSGENYESQEMFRHTLAHWLALYAMQPKVILADKHPGYFSHQYARELARSHGSRLVLVQHHEAHFAALLAEHELLHDAETVLGVVWDGTGLGRDGHIWGGEFFTYAKNKMTRCGHADYFPVIAGDKTALEPRLAALCITKNSIQAPAALRSKFTEWEWSNYQSLAGSATLLSSSVGRIFDAVASLLDVCQVQSYEGEASLLLQALAETHIAEHGMLMEAPYGKAWMTGCHIPSSGLMADLLHDLQENRPLHFIAAKFHYSLACMIGEVATRLGVTRIACSGGVFQNALLVDWIITLYGKTHQLYFHRDLSPNDENISLGQLVFHSEGMVSQDADHAIRKVRSDAVYG